MLLFDYSLATSTPVLVYRVEDASTSNGREADYVYDY
jgi:hypothetical protein